MAPVWGGRRHCSRRKPQSSGRVFGRTIRSPTTGKFRGTIRIDMGRGHTPGGLWSLGFGVGGDNGDPNTLYFSDGITGEADGLFGAIFANGNGNKFANANGP